MNNSYKDFSNYKINRFLGKGCFGYVFDVTENQSNKKYAIKRVMKNDKKISREYLLLEKLKKEKHVINLKKVIFSINDDNQLIQNFVFEYCQENLEEVLKRLKKKKINLSYKSIKQIIYQILLGIESLHTLKICHRDLKPENILIKDGLLKIADLGSAKILNQCNSPYVVSRYYRAPELFFGISNYTTKIDIWAIGVIFYEFIFRTLPFKGKTEGYQMIEIFKHLGIPDKQFQVFLRNNLNNYEDFFNLIWDLKIEENSKLWKVFDYLELPLIEKNLIIKFLKKCWCYNPEERISVEQALKSPLFNEMKLEKLFN